MEDFDIIINDLNELLLPITNEIEQNLDYLNNFIDIDNHYHFEPITKQELG